MTFRGGRPGHDGPALRPGWWRELAAGLVVFTLYALVSSSGWTGRQSVAVANGRRIFELERALHIDVEPALNRWLVQHAALRVAANYEYATTYVISAFALLFWLYLRRPATYRWARTSFILVNLVAICCFALYPLAPPRLLTDLGFVDTVLLGRTWGSWGSPLISGANQLAAMPSLHIAWAVWVGVVLAAVAPGAVVQVVCGTYVLVTTLVVMATANHYLLDVVAGAATAVLCIAVARPRGDRAAPSDTFFLHVESSAAPQHVGGVALLDCADVATLRDDLQAVVQAHLPSLPRFRQRLSAPSRWRRARWVDHPDVDWAWHVPERRLTGPDGVAALREMVAEIAGTPLPRDRPLWRFFAVSGMGGRRAAVILVVHHALADGVGTVTQALSLLDPAVPGPVAGSPAGPAADPEARPSARPAGPVMLTNAVRTAFGTAVGLAELATDGRPGHRLPSSDAARRRYGTVEVPLDDVRTVARQRGVRVSDVLLCAVAGGLRRVQPAAGHLATRLRVAVPLMVGAPSARAGQGAGMASAEGNATSAVMIDLPLGPMSELERLADVAARSRRLHTGRRALASRFVMRHIGALLPPPAHAWFARTVYGPRYFHAIVSNIPGPDAAMSLAGARVLAAYPIVPLAPGTAVAVGALGWHGSLFVGVSTDPALVDDADRLASSIAAVIGELRGAPAGSLAGMSDGPGTDRGGGAGR